jgi:hypothetical protein
LCTPLLQIAAAAFGFLSSNAWNSYKDSGGLSPHSGESRALSPKYVRPKLVRKELPEVMSVLGSLVSLPQILSRNILLD